MTTERLRACSMCGIHGLVIGPQSETTLDTLRSALDLQFRLSDSRGSEASGWAVRAPEKITVYRRPIAGSKLIRSSQHRKMLRKAMGDLNGPATGGLHPPLAVIGHSRLVTNGREAFNRNNQPVVRDGVVLVHNGIIVNHRALWESLPGRAPACEVDTEVLLCLIRKHYEETGSLVGAAQEVFSRIEGSASIAAIFDDLQKLLLATNTGSLYLLVARDGGGLAFASEEYILKVLAKDRSVGRIVGEHDIVRVTAGSGYVVDLKTCRLERFALRDKKAEVHAAAEAPHVNISVLPQHKEPCELIGGLRRCTRCILPETFPFIEFDEQGVCNFCRSHAPMVLQGHEALEELIAPHRRTDGGADCIVAFSGGRDSSYGLHYIKQELGLNPVAFTYDWGMVTDLARRNQARVCGKLGIEHIMISADIRRKRMYIRKNVEAWLRRPRLGMVPLFMAGDKQFFYYANKLRKQVGAPMMIFAVNPLERTMFKSGFCGVNEAGGNMYFRFSLAKKLRISAYYLGQYLANPGYWNCSLFDTVRAYCSAFMISHDYVMLFDYIRWEEEKIYNTLIGEYKWEAAADTHTTWRIGDGTAAFYNYIYYTVAGFTENDTFRSNQIREGMLTRDEAISRIQHENQPRWESIKWYSDVIGFDLTEAIAVIDDMPKLHDPERLKERQ